MEKGMEKTQKSHVLIIPFPSQGHINPMLQFSKRLVHKGVKPTLVTTVHLSKSMHNTAQQQGQQIQTRTITDGYDDGVGAGFDSWDVYLATLRDVGPKSLIELIEKLIEEGDPIKAIVYDGLFPWALDVAKQFGLVGVCFLTQSCVVNSVYYHVQRGLIQLPLSGPIALPGVPELQPLETSSFVYEYGSEPHWFDAVLGQFSNIDQADWVFTNIFYEMEKECVAMEELGEKSYKAHVLILPYPSQGHINPMLQFSKRLAHKGIRPTLVTTVHLSKSIHSTNTSPAKPGPHFQIRTISDGYDEGGSTQAGSSEAYLASLWNVGSRTLGELIKSLIKEGDPIKAIIYDGFFPWALDVAKQFGLVGVCFLTQSCAVNSVYYHVQRGLVQLPLSGPVKLPGIVELQPCETPSFVNKYGSYPSWFNVVVGQFSNIDKADWVLTNIFYDLENEAVDWMSKLWRIRTIGPTIPSHYLDKRLTDDNDYTHNLFKPDTSLCKNWLDTKPKGSVIYVSFGSSFGPAPEQFEEVGLGIKNSKYKFLWVVRELEQHKLPKDFINEISSSGQGIVVGWASQLEVLAHEATACFVTHCGFNSVLEVLSIGVAVVAMPIWTDQGTNAKYLEDVWGVGIRAKSDEKGIVRSGEIEGCLREVMEGSKRDEIMKNVAKWKKLAKEALDEGGSSDKNIDEFVAYVTSY